MVKRCVSSFLGLIQFGFFIGISGTIWGQVAWPSNYVIKFILLQQFCWGDAAKAASSLVSLNFPKSSDSISELCLFAMLPHGRPTASRVELVFFQVAAGVEPKHRFFSTESPVRLVSPCISGDWGVLGQIRHLVSQAQALCSLVIESHCCSFQHWTHHWPKEYLQVLKFNNVVWQAFHNGKTQVSSCQIIG